ncbi:adhesion G protein-coupled receptor E1-like, partial [Tachysurus ichikawai]
MVLCQSIELFLVEGSLGRNDLSSLRLSCNIPESQGGEQEFFLGLVDRGQRKFMVEERDEKKVSVAEAKGSEEKDKRVPEATEEGEIE